MNAPLVKTGAYAPVLISNPEPLRVAIFSGNYNYVMDGPVRALNKLVAHLEERGHEVLVFSPTVKEPAFEHEGELVSIPSIPLPGTRSEYRMGLGLFGAAMQRLDSFKPNLIHLASPDITSLAALKYAETQGVTPVASFHTRFDTYPRYYNAAWLEKHLTSYMRNFYGRCEHVYTPSQSMADELTGIGFGKNIRLWQRGVDRGIFNPLRRDIEWRRRVGFADDDIVVAFVGRIVLEKGIDLFAEAVMKASAAHPKIKPLIVGEGPERARFAQHLPTGIFTGYLSGEALARAYASADLFFNPSITETFGNVTLEAMACGLPALCAAASGSVSLVESGRTGLLCKPCEGADGFAVQLARLASDELLRARCGKNAVERARKFSWPAILDALIEDYRDAMATRFGRQSRHG